SCGSRCRILAVWFRGELVKKLAACILGALLAFIALAPVPAQAASAADRQRQKSNKRSQKAMKKMAKNQKKAQKNGLKSQKKATKAWKKQHPNAY
ncbi:MAG: hypothetical protein ABSD88_00505, partial [Candidatus Korobacteraceae bacterium]